jgi:hypothetical protein
VRINVRRPRTLIATVVVRDQCVHRDESTTDGDNPMSGLRIAAVLRAIRRLEKTNSSAANGAIKQLQRELAVRGLLLDMTSTH